MREAVNKNFGRRMIECAALLRRKYIFTHKRKIHDKKTEPSELRRTAAAQKN